MIPQGSMIIIHERFVAKIVDFGSLVLDRPLDQDYPCGTTARAITPQDAHGVDGQDRLSSNRIPNIQGISSQIGDRSDRLKTQA